VMESVIVDEKMPRASVAKKVRAAVSTRWKKAAASDVKRIRRLPSPLQRKMTTYFSIRVGRAQ